MIQITNKPEKRPAILYKDGKDKGKDRLEVATDKLIATFEEDPNLFTNPTKDNKIEFDSSLYGHDDIKTTLIESQFDKCCFCEAKVSHVAYGDVEHFRPKAAYRQEKGDTLKRPGYFWLAYDWDNLLFSCQLCNQRYKENLFPLYDTRTRITKPTQDWKTEQSIFIHPVFEDPEIHITFVNGDVKAKTVRGYKTLKALGLDRIKLTDRRSEQLEPIQSLINIYNIYPDIEPYKTQAKNEILKMAPKILSPQSEYSSMFKANFKDFIDALQTNLP